MTLMVSRIDCSQNEAEIAILDGVEKAVSEMPFEVLNLEKFETEYFRDGYYVVEIDILVYDYGVPEVGIDIISTWCGKVFDYTLPFMINELLIHPGDHTYGTLIKYDPGLGKVLVIRLKEQ